MPVLDDITEPEIYDAIRGWKDSQAAFDGLGTFSHHLDVQTGWYDYHTDPRRGALCYVQSGHKLAPVFAGEILRVTCNKKSCLVYCVGENQQDKTLMLQWRAFRALRLPSWRELHTRVEVMR